MKKDRLNEVLKLHELWLGGDDGGVKADLRKADLSFTNRRGAEGI